MTNNFNFKLVTSKYENLITSEQKNLNELKIKLQEYSSELYVVQNLKDGLHREDQLKESFDKLCFSIQDIEKQIKQSEDNISFYREILSKAQILQQNEQ